jgi:acetylornithine aminotransferase/acetylornithine/N-succinyldiaminopimelate aminotransferase
MAMTTETMTNFAEIAAREEEFQLATYKKFPFAPVRGEGSWVETSEGERFLDLYGGHAVCATGHCHPRVVEALREQAGRLLFYSNVVYSDVRAAAAEKLVGCAPASVTKAFFCNSGTEANENAMRMARMRTGREGIITFTGGFHGRTADSISATFLGRYRDIGRPNVPGHLCAEFGSIESVAALADETVAAVMLEPIQSMAGVRLAPPEFYQDLRRLCDGRGMLLIFDEVQTGVGRTGSWFFAGSEAAGGVVPDVITLAKALGSGVPVGACLTTEGVASSIKENDLGTTFGGGMLAMAAVSATLEAIEADGMLANASAVEAFLRGSLAGVPSVAGVHGRGLLLGIELAEPVAAQVNKALLERRIITGTSSDPKVLRLLPPLCVTTEEAGMFVGALKEILA